MKNIRLTVQQAASLRGLVNDKQDALFDKLTAAVAEKQDARAESLLIWAGVTSSGAALWVRAILLRRTFAREADRWGAERRCERLSRIAPRPRHDLPQLHRASLCRLHPAQ